MKGKNYKVILFLLLSSSLLLSCSKQNISTQKPQTKATKKEQPKKTFGRKNPPQLPPLPQPPTPKKDFVALVCRSEWSSAIWLLNSNMNSKSISQGIYLTDMALLANKNITPDRKSANLEHIGYPQLISLNSDEIHTLFTARGISRTGTHYLYLGKSDALYKWGKAKKISRIPSFHSFDRWNLGMFENQFFRRHLVLSQKRILVPTIRSGRWVYQILDYPSLKVVRTFKLSVLRHVNPEIDSSGNYLAFDHVVGGRLRKKVFYIEDSQFYLLWKSSRSRSVRENSRFSFSRQEGSFYFVGKDRSKNQIHKFDSQLKIFSQLKSLGNLDFDFEISAVQIGDFEYLMTTKTNNSGNFFHFYNSATSKFEFKIAYPDQIKGDPIHGKEIDQISVVAGTQFNIFVFHTKVGIFLFRLNPISKQFEQMNQRDCHQAHGAKVSI